MDLSFRAIAHHAAEAAACIFVGNGFSNMPTACASYGVGKIVYIASRIFLENSGFALSNQAMQALSWTAALVAGGATYQAVLQKTRGYGTDIKTIAQAITTATAISIGVRALVDQTLKFVAKRI